MNGSNPGNAVRQIDVRYMGATVRVPNTVVHRSFPNETIVLDLTAGVYHGLNHVAGRMLELLGELGRVRLVADRLAEEFDAPPAQIQRDLCRVCQDLVDLGLIELDEPLS
ncbi:MAG TPA: PqqD family protein [Solirubrobacterales bacterium]|nr:PqqD family protein [Solirubrobacterales bacterium]